MLSNKELDEILSKIKEHKKIIIYGNMIPKELCLKLLSDSDYIINYFKKIRYFNDEYLKGIIGTDEDYVISLHISDDNLYYNSQHFPTITNLKNINHITDINNNILDNFRNYFYYEADEFIKNYKIHNNLKKILNEK